MSLEYVDYLEGSNLNIDPKKIRLPKRVNLDICKTADGHYYVSLGTHSIFNSRDEISATEFFHRTMVLVESGNYELIINSDFCPKIRPL